MPIDPDRLDTIANELAADASLAKDDGNTARALELYARAETLHAWAFEDRRRLTAGRQRRKVSDVLETGHRQRLSESRYPAAEGSWLEVARKAGLPSLRAVAKALGCTPQFLSAIAKGDKKMPADKAARFEELTGWPSTGWAALEKP